MARINPMKSGSLLGSYKIIRPLGSGGMGEVYLAEDTELDRLVAVKILPEEFGSNPDYMRRFLCKVRRKLAVLISCDV